MVCAFLELFLSNLLLLTHSFFIRVISKIFYFFFYFSFPDVWIGEEKDITRMWKPLKEVTTERRSKRAAIDASGACALDHDSHTPYKRNKAEGVLRTSNYPRTECKRDWLPAERGTAALANWRHWEEKVTSNLSCTLCHLVTRSRLPHSPTPSSPHSRPPSSYQQPIASPMSSESRHFVDQPAFRPCAEASSPVSSSLKEFFIVS